MLQHIAKKVFGTRNDRILKSLKPLLERVNSFAEPLQGLTNDQLKARTAQFRERLERGESIDSIEAESYAVVREAATRVLGMRHFEMQIIGGAVLHRGMISEMKTGEGKTLVATLPSYLNALSGKGVHVVTVNDYLARRDAEWMGQLHQFLGLEVGCVYPGLSEEDKLRAYKADITYGQNNEFGFDYLRDNMKYSLPEMFQRGHHFAIVDEVDSILIDEARTPLIISGPIDESTEKYYEINKIIPYLQKEKDYEVDLRSKNPHLTEDGVAHAEKLLSIENLYDPQHIEVVHHVNQALKAHTTMERDVDYVVKNGQVIIVDEFTGRLMAGRRWSNGLHQAVEAKEGLKVQRENQTLASITFQNYFRMYQKLAGMTGTADTEAVEFKQIYNLEVVAIPTNRPMVRQDMSDLVFRTREEKYKAVIDDIAELHKTGHPVLVGTISIEQSETLARQLKESKVPHNVLNAKQHEREAEIVAQAGRYGAVTISTNMAGRGTDIVLGGNPEFLAFNEAGTKDKADPAYTDALKKFKKLCEEEKQKVLEVGGLAILGTERHESRRIDNQLRGRAGRQGDPGVSRFYVSLEDDLMRRFAGDKIQIIMNRLGWEEGAAMDGRLISHSIETAQKRVEAMHFESRKHVTEYDDVMNRQRQVVYTLRNQMLEGEGIDDKIQTMMDDLIEDTLNSICDEKVKSAQWDIDKLRERYTYLFNHEVIFSNPSERSAQLFFDEMKTQAREHYSTRVHEKEQKLMALREFAQSEQTVVRFHDAVPLYRDIERRTVLEVVDYFWNSHIQQMEELREGIGLRGYGQKNPLYEYQREGYLLFQQTLSAIKEAVVRRLSFEEIMDVQSLLRGIEEEEHRRQSLEQEMTMIHEEASEDKTFDAVANDSTEIEGVELKDPVEERARRETLRRERRKKRK